MKRSVILSLVFVLVLAIGGTAFVLVQHYKPELGLDLQGGAYVVLQPKNKVESGVLQQSVGIIRQRVDALGVAEPDISTQGSSIIVQLPGVKDQERALSIVGQTAELRFRPVLQAGIPPGATASTTTTTAPETTTTAGGTDTGTTAATTSTTTIAGATPRDQDLPDKEVVLPEMKDGQVTQLYRLGPAKATGRIVKTAVAQAPQGLGPDWSVGVNLTGDGNTQFNQLAAICYDKTPECPTGQISIVLDGVVKSAPTVQERQFSGQVQITGTFTQSEASDLALVLKYGSLPVELVPQSTQTVSATLGKDSLHAGIVAGLIGLGLVVLYMILYYRALGIVVILGLCVSGLLMWTIIAILGSTRGLALTLSGAVGIIVSVGVTVDSYIVYFERLKDEIRSGKTIRSSVDRGFQRAYRTTVAADLSSLIGAAVLYLLTVGSVRGFAFFLGISALLDLFVAYFFTRPMVIMLGRNRFFTEAPFFGVARGLAASEATA
ncbi:MAG TPA: protein translocase subunit SecD [Acidimicrobiales bacterium]|nr:protein translocase subunit SecD [Acidimicrobiales bacterium]